MTIPPDELAPARVLGPGANLTHLIHWPIPKTLCGQSIHGFGVARVPSTGNERALCATCTRIAKFGDD
jgi:hypothetical protein